MEPRICAVCILPDTTPGVTFNAQGVCNVCEAAARSADTAPRPERADDEQKILEAFVARRRWDRYDCLCLYSGGKDSTYMLYALARRLNLRVLALTLDNWFISPQTHANIKSTMRYAHVAPSTLRAAIDMLNPRSLINANFGQPVVNQWHEMQKQELVQKHSVTKNA